MADVHDLQEKLRDTVAVIALMERELPIEDRSPSDELNMKSLYTRKRRLEEKLADALNEVGAEVLRLPAVLVLRRAHPSQRSASTRLPAHAAEAS